RLGDELEPKMRAYIAASRHWARLSQRLIMAVATVFAAVAIFAGWQYHNAEAAKQQSDMRRIEADQQRNDAEKNLAAAQLTQSRFLASLATQKDYVGNPGGVIGLELEALPDSRSGKLRSYAPEAESALFAGWQALREVRVFQG